MMRRAEIWVAFIARWHRTILVASVLLAAVSALSLRALRFDFDVLGMLPAGAPAFDNFKRFVQDFGELNELVILVRSRDIAALHAFADAFASRLRKLDTVSNVRARVDVSRIEEGILGDHVANYIPLAEYDRLAAELSPQGIDELLRAQRAVLQAPFDLRAAQWVRRDPLGLARRAGRALQGTLDAAALHRQDGYLSAAGGTAVLILVRPAQGPFDTVFTTRFMRQVREAEARADSGARDVVTVRYTGSYAFALEDATALKGDVAQYTILALLGVLAVFYLGFRNLRILPYVTYPVLLSTLLTFLASLACYAQLNAVSISFAAILYGLSIDSAIHYYARLLQERQRHELQDAVARTLSALGGANVAASATTAAAFAIIGASQLAGVSQLGGLTAIGMLINIAQFFVLYPALSFLLPRRSFEHVPPDMPRLGRVAGAAVRYRRPIAWSTAAAGTVLLALALRVPFDADLTRLRPAASAAATVQAEVEGLFGGAAAPAALLVEAPALEAALQASERIAVQLDAYRAAHIVTGFRAITGLLPSERTQRERLARFNALPRRRIAHDLQAALARHGFVPGAFDPFFQAFAPARAAIVRHGDPALQPFEELVARHVRSGARSSLVATYIEVPAGTTIDAVATRLQHDLPDVPFVVAARSLLESALSRLLRRELIGFCLLSLMANLVLIWWNFRSVGMSLAILAPQGVVIVALLAFLAVTGIGIGPITLVVVPLILGIGVDYCIYVAERVRHGEGPAAAVRNGGRALVVSGLTTMAGFGFLGLSRYPALAHMGLFTAASLFLCGVGAVTVLPALLSLWGARRDDGMRS